MRDDIEQLLINLKLKGMLQIVERELERVEHEAPSYTDFLAGLLRYEYASQQARFLEYRIRRAKLPQRWEIDTFPWDKQPGVRRALVEQLAELDFLVRGANIVFIGPTGVGKTGLACSLLMQALRAGHRGLFVKAQDLFDDMHRSLADFSSRRLLNSLVRMDLLVIDEMGYLNLRPEQSNIFFKLMEERYDRPGAATILTTNLDYDEWYAFLGNKQMVGALLDRLRHHCHTVRIDGPSLRTPQG